jgi:hypothetical protein
LDVQNDGEDEKLTYIWSWVHEMRVRDGMGVYDDVAWGIAGTTVRVVRKK